MLNEFAAPLPLANVKQTRARGIAYLSRNFPGQHEAQIILGIQDQPGLLEKFGFMLPVPEDLAAGKTGQHSVASQLRKSRDPADRFRKLIAFFLVTLIVPEDRRPNNLMG